MASFSFSFVELRGSKDRAEGKHSIGDRHRKLLSFRCKDPQILAMLHCLPTLRRGKPLGEAGVDTSGDLLSVENAARGHLDQKQSAFYLLLPHFGGV